VGAIAVKTADNIKPWAQTRNAGEAFDKDAAVKPGGQQLIAWLLKGNPQAFVLPEIFLYLTAAIVLTTLALVALKQLFGSCKSSSKIPQEHP